MSLQSLPPEILLQILQCLDSSFFRQDVSRLAICRWWYALAQPVLFRDLHFSASSLHRFAEVARRTSRLASVLQHVATITLAVNGFDDWGSPRLLPDLAGVNLDVVNDWTSRLSKDLSVLGRLLPRLPKLHAVSLTAWQERYDPRVGIPRRSYLDSMATVGAICTASLTSLDIDIGGTYLIQEWPVAEFHPCHMYRAIPRALRRLRVRAMLICPTILKVITPSDGALVLEDVIINLSLSNMSSFDSSYRYPTRCQRVPGGIEQLREDMEAQAVELVRALENPRIVRVISHTFPGLETHSFDAVTGCRMKLSAPTPWDADGTVLTKPDSDTESEISDVDL